jgi:CDP-6-deoxy-D-xylo-4-hexulose-3-dehydrase
MSLNWPLMTNNITREDLDTIISFLKEEPVLTQSKNVEAFEKEWSDWLGVKHSVFVNSGSSANLISMSVLKHLYGSGEVILPALTWVSDIASVIQCGFKPVFVDIKPDTLSIDEDQALSRITPETRAVFLTHAQGFNGLSDKLLDGLKEKNIPLIEDVCESHGATFKNQKLGSFGLMSNFSFYYAHHMSTIEGGMVCTNDEDIYEICRMLRSHGMVREMKNTTGKQNLIDANPKLNPQFIFALPGFNMRNNEIGAVLGRNQLKRLDANNGKRRHNFKFFLDHIDSEKFQTDFRLEGSSNYAFNLVLQKPDLDFCERVMQVLQDHQVEFRRGSSGGGNQLRQPYLKGIIADDEHKKYPVVEHIHFYGFYIGNYPGLEEIRIKQLCDILNRIE